MFTLNPQNIRQTFKLFLLVYVVLSAISFILINHSKKNEITELLDRTSNTYQLAYQTIYQQYNFVSRILYTGLLSRSSIKKIYQQLQTADEGKKKQLRLQLFRVLEKRYLELKQFSQLRQLHFHLSNNESFLRMHRPDKYGDDLTAVRKTVAKVNSSFEPVDGFEEGKIYCGFRYVYPIKADDNSHLGSVEISFSAVAFSTKFIQHYDIFPHFYIRSSIVEEKLFDSEKSNYQPSIFTGFYADKEVLKAQNFPIDDELVKPDEKLIHQMINNVNAGRVKSVYDDKNKQLLTTIPILNPVTRNVVAFFEIHSHDPRYKQIQEHFYLKLLIGQLLISIIFFVFYLLLANNKIIEREANFDKLTGIYNRRKFEDVFKYELLQSKRHKQKLSIAMMDIDLFKNFNDNYGHQVGDLVLKSLAKNILSRIRKSDTFARWGGEEFVLIMTETSINEAVKVCEKLRRSVQKNVKVVQSSNITISIGISELKENDTTNRLFKRCDEALYLAKNNGRNRVEYL